MFSFELDRQNKKICLTLAEYSLSVINFLEKADSKSYFLEAENLKLTLDKHFIKDNMNYDISENSKNNKYDDQIRLFIEKNFKKPKCVEILLLDYLP